MWAMVSISFAIFVSIIQATELQRRAIAISRVSGSLRPESKHANESQLHRPSGLSILRYRSGKTRPICRLYGACLTAEGRFLLPKSMEKHKAVLSASYKAGGCDIERANQAAKPLLRKPLYVLRDFPTDPITFRDPDSGIQYEAGFDSSDLLSTQLFSPHQRTPPSHIPHFAYQVVPWLFVLDELKQNEQMHRHRAEQVLHFGNHSGDMINPRIFLSSSMHKMWTAPSASSAFAWVVSFLDRLESHGVRFSKTPPPQSMTCHKSIVLHTNSMISIPYGSLAAHEAVVSRPQKSSLGSKTKLTILQRNSTRRSFHDLEQVVRLVRAAAERVIGPENISVNSVSFDQSYTLDMQVSVMSDTDVLITPHGAGLANVLFQMPGSQVIEVAPFGFCSGFEHFSRAAGLDHIFLFAKPDVEKFSACIEAELQRQSSGEDSKEMLRRTQTAFDEMVELNVNYGESAVERICGNRTLYREISASSIGRRCGRDQQRIVVDSIQLENAIQRSILRRFHSSGQ